MLSHEEPRQPELPAFRLTPELLESRLRPLMQGDPVHDWNHVCRVFTLGLRIYETLQRESALLTLAGEHHASRHWEGHQRASEPALRVALLCHDMAGKDARGRTNVVGPEDLATLLEGIPLHPATLAIATEAINEHSWSGGASPSGLASAIVQDADRLDAIGAIGVARCFSHGGRVGRSLYDPEGGSDALGHFDQKLLQIKGRLNLLVSRRLAVERHRFLEDFKQQFLAEWHGES